MSPQDFFYWLQGFFELSLDENSPPVALSDSQIRCIIRHDRLVATSSGDGRGEQMIKIGVMLELMLDNAIDRVKGTEAVRRMVAHQFQHVIDPKAGDDAQQAKLNTIHDLGRVDPKTGVIYRC